MQLGGRLPIIYLPLVPLDLSGFLRCHVACWPRLCGNAKSFSEYRFSIYKRLPASIGASRRRLLPLGLLFVGRNALVRVAWSI